MSILNFREIPPGNISDGTQDTFELLARDLLSNLGFKIVSEPNRGADGGKDMLAIETRFGKYNNSEIRWLISCKHKAHSGESVSPTDEENIIDRVHQFQAQGFLGFYSTIISSGLSTRLDSYKKDMEILIFDNAKIEGELLKNENVRIAKRYFPVSLKKWISENIKPVHIFHDYEPLRCEVCKKDLLMENGQPHPSGIIAFVNSISTREESDYSREKVLNIYAACKGRCDRSLENYWYERNGITGWADIEDLANPQEYLRWNMAIINELESGNIEYSVESFEKLKYIILGLPQLTVREPSERERERFNVLQSLPRL